MTKITETKIDQLIQDNRNLNKGTEQGKRLITKSLSEFGAGRSVLIDKNNRIIAGNKTHENAKEIGMEDVIVVETDGTKLVAVKRTDVDLDSKQGREMALADNATVKVDLEWDEEGMQDVSEEYGIELGDWGIETESPEDNPYTMKVESPVYEAKGTCPPIEELYDKAKADELMAEIDGEQIESDVKMFLKLAAMRHVVFDYGRIAEFYCHASAKVQRLMERSALIIIDFQDAIEGGYVQLRQDIRELMKGDVFDEE